MKRLGVLLLVLAIFASTLMSVQPAQAGISSFTASPPSPVKIGTWVTLRGTGDAGTSRFTINGEPRAELGSPVNVETWKTEEFHVGFFRICFQLRQSGGWENAEERCLDYEVQGADSGGQTTGGVDFTGYCKAQGFDRFTGEQNNAYTGKCAGGDREVGLNMYEVCAWQYGGRLPYPGLSDANNMSSWTCNAQQAYIAPPSPAAQPSQPTPIPASGGSTSSAGGNSGLITDARQAGTQGGVDLIYVCHAYGYSDARNTDGTANGWQCFGGKGTWNVDWNQVCKSVYGSIYRAENPSNTANGWRCITGSQSSSGGSGNSSGNNGGGSNSGSPQRGSGAACSAPEPISVGGRARVTPGDPNRLRSGAGTGYGVIGQIPGGGEFDVIGGPVCNDGYRWWKVLYNGKEGWTADGDDNVYWVEQINSGGSSGVGVPNNIYIMNVFYAPLNFSYQLKIDKVTCKIVNGSEVIASELNRFDSWSRGLPLATYLDQIRDYFEVNSGGIEDLRMFLEDAIGNSVGCYDPIYKVGSNNYSDMSCLGNIVFGFYSEWYPRQIEGLIARWKQSQNSETPNQWWDNPDDITQRDTGRAIASYMKSGSNLNASLVEKAAHESYLY